jgi:hypothetical protein
MATPAAAYASLTRQTSRAALQGALKASDYKDLSLWAALIRYDILAAAAGGGGGGGPSDAEPWRALARLAESCIVNNREAWKAAPALYLAVTLDHTRALLRAGATGDAKRTLGSLRSVGAAKYSWEFFKLLAIIECKQGACGGKGGALGAAEGLQRGSGAPTASLTPTPLPLHPHAHCPCLFFSACLSLRH